MFYHDNEEIKQNNDNKEKDLEQRKVVITASELYDKLLNICKTLYDNLSKAHKKKVNVLNKPKKLKFLIHISMKLKTKMKSHH